MVWVICGSFRFCCASRRDSSVAFRLSATGTPLLSEVHSQRSGELRGGRTKVGSGVRLKPATAVHNT